jgi:hypothetical protein
MHNGSDISDAILATATLVDFPEFRDLHGFIFAFFEPLGAHAIYDPTQYLFNPQQWELYVKYRQLLSEFLTDRGRSGTLFVGTAHYLKLAPSFWSFIVGEPSNPGIFTVQE